MSGSPENSDPQDPQRTADFWHVFRAVDKAFDVRNPILCELITVALDNAGKLPTEMRKKYNNQVQPQAFDAIDQAVQQLRKGCKGEHRRQSMRARHAHILGNVLLDCDDDWDPIINVLCEKLQQATDQRKAPQVRALLVKDDGGELLFRVSEANEYQRGLIAMAEALSPAAGGEIGGVADVEAKYKSLIAQHARILARVGPECDYGWLDLIFALCHALQYATDHLGGPQIEARQVKEKFGELRFYVGQANAYQRGLIEMTCAMSTWICEKCGQPGSVWVSEGYFHTACNEHRRANAITVENFLLQRQAQFDAIEHAH
jgi:hypothetical protein